MEMSRSRPEPFYATRMVPPGDSLYVRAKKVQVIEKNLDKAILLFWAAINVGDRVDYALKDMAILMRKQRRPEDAIKAIQSLRRLCSPEAQDSLDNLLLDLYKRCGRLDDQIELLRKKLFLIQQRMACNMNTTKIVKSRGKKYHVSLGQEESRLFGKLGWALMEQKKYAEAEDAYRRGLLVPDDKKSCNLAICLMKRGRTLEAKEVLGRVPFPRAADSHLKAFERAVKMLSVPGA